MVDCSPEVSGLKEVDAVQVGYVHTPVKQRKQKTF